MPNILPILIVFVLFFLGVPVAFAMLIASFIYFTFMCDGVNMFTMVSSLLTNSESFTMLAVPFLLQQEQLWDMVEYQKILWTFVKCLQEDLLVVWEQQTVFYQRSWEEFPVHPVQMQHLKRKC